MRPSATEITEQTWDTHGHNDYAAHSLHHRKQHGLHQLPFLAPAPASDAPSREASPLDPSVGLLTLLLLFMRQTAGSAARGQPWPSKETWSGRPKPFRWALNGRKSPIWPSEIPMSPQCRPIYSAVVPVAGIVAPTPASRLPTHRTPYCTMMQDGASGATDSVTESPWRGLVTQW